MSGPPPVSGAKHRQELLRTMLGFGRVVERPWAVDGLLGVRPVTVATLAADHRATDGFTGGRFRAAVDVHLQHPEDL